MFIFYCLLNESTGGPFQNNVFGVKIGWGKLVQSWSKSTFKKNILFFPSINLKNPLAQNSFQKHCYYARPLFISSFINITLRKWQKKFTTWPGFVCASIRKKIRKIRKIRKNNNFQNHRYKRTDGLSGQDRWLLALETI